MKLTHCPHCHRDVGTKDDRYRYHMSDTRNSMCPMSRMLLPAEGDSEVAFEKRAKLVADLACQMQEEDPAAVFHYLTAISGDELPRLMMVALAAIDVSRSESELWGWVNELPAARVAS